MQNPAFLRQPLALVAACSLVLLTGCGAGDAFASDRSGGGRIGVFEPSTTGPETSAAADRQPGEEVTAGEFADLYRAALDQATTTHVTISSTGEREISAEGDVDYGADPVSAVLTTTLAQFGGEIELRLVDEVLYLRMPMLSDKFVKVDLDGPANELGSMMQGPLDPDALLRLLENGIGAATYVGQEDVSGEQLDHYTVELDPAALVDQLPQASGLADELPDPVTVDVWFDEAGLLSKMALDLGATAGSLEVGFSDWGQDVTIEAPPSDEVVDMPTMPH